MQDDKGQLDRVVGLMEKLAAREPFFAHIILGQKIVVDHKNTMVPTMGVDGLRLYMNPNFTRTLNDAELTGVLIHEALHIAFQHPIRRGDRDPTLYNIACDAVINNILAQHNYTLPKDGVFIPVKNHETSEEVYERLKQSGMGKGNDKMPNWGMVLDLSTGEGRPMTQEEAFEMQKKVAEAAQQARGVGKMPGEWEAILDTTYYGQKDWRDMLRKFLNGGHERERTWTRPSRRHPDVIMPGLGRYGPGEIAVFLDTSGSIDDALANKFVAELRKITEDMTPDAIHVLCCDTRVQWERTYSGYEPITDVQFRGRGGTDFKPPFDWLRERGITPKAVVYFTDLICSSFPEKTPYPVMWVVWPGGADRVPFGEIVRMI